MIDWKNVDLKSHEVNENILDPYSFRTLLLEVNCNLKEINKETILKQFNDELAMKVRVAKEIFADNLDNIVNHAKKERGK